MICYKFLEHRKNEPVIGARTEENWTSYLPAKGQAGKWKGPFLGPLVIDRTGFEAVNLKFLAKWCWWFPVASCSCDVDYPCDWDEDHYLTVYRAETGKEYLQGDNGEIRTRELRLIKYLGCIVGCEINDESPKTWPEWLKEEGAQPWHGEYAK